MNGAHWFLSPSDESIWEYRPAGKQGTVVNSMKFNHARLQWEDRNGATIGRFFEDAGNHIEAGAPVEQKGQRRLAL